MTTRGDFEYCGEEYDRPVYRVRWSQECATDESAALSQEEMQRALFIRYLIQSGRVGEGLAPLSCRRWSRVDS